MRYVKYILKPNMHTANVGGMFCSQCHNAVVSLVKLTIC